MYWQSPAAGAMRLTPVAEIARLQRYAIPGVFRTAAGSLREIHDLCVDFFCLFLVGLFKELLLR